MILNKRPGAPHDRRYLLFLSTYHMNLKKSVLGVLLVLKRPTLKTLTIPVL